MTILDTIVRQKRLEVDLKKTIVPLKEMERSRLFDRETISLVQRLNSSHSGIIAEFKRRSPSKAVINQGSTVNEVARGYEHAGACGMSVLTDSTFFGGSLDDLKIARAACEIPLLRKDFVLEPYQIIEAKAAGADVVLLIAAILEPKTFTELNSLAKSLNLEVLAEVHNEKELLDIIDAEVDMIGVNNRNLKTFDVSLHTSKRLSEIIPDSMTKVSESGLHSARVITELRSFGYRGFLIGESFMKTDNPGIAATNLIKVLDDEA
ncbi:MAG: indole-3-glycerol phosphate synthase TrpC [Flavobacteriaceae bacterium]|nr:indole-3-glycerol phosphate synthase TrpC [Flavobacteriaceae bacterium]